MVKVTYLIGAGASFHSLPLIKTMNTRMRAYSEFLKEQQSEGKLKHSFCAKFLAHLDELIEIERQRTSIDAYARELSIRGEEMELLRLKAVLSGYLLFEQLIKPSGHTFTYGQYNLMQGDACRVAYNDQLQECLRTHLDKRYITFWGEHLSPGSDRLPDNIRILSWNYDMQFESSFSQVKNCSLELAQQNLQVFPSPLQGVDLERSCILKLNGTAGLIDDYSQKRLYNLFDCRAHHLMDNLTYLIDLLEHNYQHAFNKPLFAFAWEDEGIVRQTREYAQKVAEDTEILVVIGYSFPNFNKSVDREIFKSIPKLRKVYYQAPQAEIPDLLDRLEGVHAGIGEKTKAVTNLDTFYVPVEL